MIGALREGAVDAVVDDDVALLALAGDPGLEIAFTVPTRNAWGVAVAKDRPQLCAQIDGALAQIIAAGELEAAWRRWMPGLLPARFRRGALAMPALVLITSIPRAIETTLPGRMDNATINQRFGELVAAAGGIPVATRRVERSRAAR